MSEYQYYEFTAIDRPLDESQVGQLRALSTRARITPTGFVNSYQWGDLRGDPRQMMERYFDAFLYLANWGTHRVMFRLPARLLDLGVAERFCVGDAAQAWISGEHLILDLYSEDEEGDWENDGEGMLAGIISVRAELASGDLRALYLAWLSCVQVRELDDEEPEPPVPPGLGALSGGLRSLAEFLRVDPDLLAGAATASPPRAAHQRSDELARWVKTLPTTSKDEALLRVLSGDHAHLRAELLRRFSGCPRPSHAGDGNRTVRELLDAAESRRADRQREAERQRAAERARRERVAPAAREQRLQALASREDEAWQDVDALIDTKRPKESDAAVELLCDLQAVGERNGSNTMFSRRLRGPCERHQRKPSLMERMQRAGLTRGVGAS